MKKLFSTVLFIGANVLSSLAQQAGDLDLTFGTNGSVITDLGNGYDQCSGLVIQPDLHNAHLIMK